MMFDDAPPAKKPELVFRNLDMLSVTALEEYISELKSEIGRAEAEIVKRGSARDKAESFFKKDNKQGK